MPTYEYACKGCGEHLEVVQSFKDDPLTTCPSCEGELRKVFSAAGIIFKGSGWHVKDYASSRSGGAAGSGGASADAGSGGEGAAASGEGSGTSSTSSKSSSSSSSSGSSDAGGASASKPAAKSGKTDSSAA